MSHSFLDKQGDGMLHHEARKNENTKKIHRPSVFLFVLSCFRDSIALFLSYFRVFVIQLLFCIAYLHQSAGLRKVRQLDSQDQAIVL